jgi:hypothetical protein
MDNTDKKDIVVNDTDLLYVKKSGDGFIELVSPKPVDGFIKTKILYKDFIMDYPESVTDGCHKYSARTGKITKSDAVSEDMKTGIADQLRQRRENECFPVINRGNLWYSTLTDDQRTELTAWYKAWLDCTDTLSAPEKPAWLK